MSDVLPAPLTPADCDLQDFKFMPLDVSRLRDSDLAALETAEAFRAAVLLWCASWHQVPAASLPDDDKVLAQLAGFGRVVREWLKERKGALRGWIRCSDGRLYHPVVAEKAREAWRSKLEGRWMRECKRIRKHNERHHTTVPLPEFEDWLAAGCRTGEPLPVADDKPPVSHATTVDGRSDVADDRSDNRQGHGQGQGHRERNTQDTRTAETPARVSMSGAICVALKAEGIGNCNPGHPDLAVLIDQGAEVQNFVAAARTARDKGKGFAYVLGIVKGQLAEARQLAAAGRTTTTSTLVSGSSGGAARAARMAEAVPNLAAKAHRRGDFIDTEATDVTARQVG